jgi:hypothetical protein
MLTMSVSSTLTSAVMTDMSARVMRVDPSAFWMPTTTVSPSRTGTLVTRPSKGAREMVLSRASKLARWLAMAWSRWARWESVWALAWASAALRWASVAFDTSYAAFLASKSCLAMSWAL